MRKLFIRSVVTGILLSISFTTLNWASEKGVRTTKVKIASLSFIPVKWDKEANLKTMESMAREAVSKGAEILITPEGALEGYLINVTRRSNQRPEIDKEFFEIAESINGPSVTRIIKLVKELKVNFVLGFLEREGNILYNSCAWINSQGKVIHVHRKTHMAQPYFDPEFYHPGYELKAFDTAHGCMGMLICHERQIPEVSLALSLDGARILVNPSYGARGEWNDSMLRNRARDNSAYFIFSHPQQALVIGPNGNIMVNVDNDRGAGIVYAQLDKKALGKPITLHRRRPEVFARKLSSHIYQGNQRLSRSGHIKVASVQMRCVHDLKENVKRIQKHLTACALQGVRVALFPECATTGYFKNEIPKYTEQNLLEAEKAIAATCDINDIYCIVGSPYFQDGKRYNMALVIDDNGKTIYRQAKIQLVSGDKNWAEPGNSLSIFNIDDKKCSIIICHDSRYPELVRLPVIKGSRLVFYLSWESDIESEYKIVPYRAQVVARAVENMVYIVQANAPQTLKPLEGSHGQSRIVGPNGVMIKEASILGEDVLVAELDLKKASGGTAQKSLRANFLKTWWENGIKQVGDIKGGATSKNTDK